MGLQTGRRTETETIPSKETNAAQRDDKPEISERFIAACFFIHKNRREGIIAGFVHSSPENRAATRFQVKRSRCRFQ